MEPNSVSIRTILLTVFSPSTLSLAYRGSIQNCPARVIGDRSRCGDACLKTVDDAMTFSCWLRRGAAGRLVGIEERGCQQDDRLVCPVLPEMDHSLRFGEHIAWLQ